MVTCDLVVTPVNNLMFLFWIEGWVTRVEISYQRKYVHLAKINNNFIEINKTERTLEHDEITETYTTTRQRNGAAVGTKLWDFCVVSRAPLEFAKFLAIPHLAV